MGDGASGGGGVGVGRRRALPVCVCRRGVGCGLVWCVVCGVVCGVWGLRGGARVGLRRRRSWAGYFWLLARGIARGTDFLG